MDNFQKDILANMILAPYLQVSTALIGKSRLVGGNQFRHTWATVGILIDHKIMNSVILKAAVLHDLKEDAPESYFPDKIRAIDADGYRVVELIEELSINTEFETKPEYLQRVMIHGSPEAKIIKLADRISNLTDIQLGTFNIEKVVKTIEETKEYILPFAEAINKNMYLEMKDLVESRTLYIHKAIEHIAAKIMTILIENIEKIRCESGKKTTELVDFSLSEIKKIIDSPSDEKKYLIQDYFKNEIGQINKIISETVDAITETLKSEIISNKISPYSYQQKL